jgi:hypothetical protein
MLARVNNASAIAKGGFFHGATIAANSAAVKRYSGLKGEIHLYAGRFVPNAMPQQLH